MTSSAFRLILAVAAAVSPVVLVAQDAASVLDQLTKSMGREVPRVLRLTAAGSGYRPAKDDPAKTEHFRIEPHTETFDAGSNPAALWTTPHGFVAGAVAGKASVSKETLAGSPYTVVTFAAPAGHQVRGYVNAENVLERTRTEVPGPGGKTIPFEAVFMSWVDFAGLKYPSVIVHKENNQVSRILVVEKAE